MFSRGPGDRIRPSGSTALNAFTPPAARRVLGDDARVALISSAVVAEQRAHLGGPVLEVTWPGTCALLGTMRAVREHGALLTISLPDVFDLDDPASREQLVRAVAGVSEEAELAGPIVIARRLRGRFAAEADVESALPALLGLEADAGFTSFALRPAELRLDDPADLIELVAPAVEMGAGIELEFEPRDRPALLLALLDEAGMRAAAVRGAGAHDELLGGLLAVDPLRDELTSEVPLRVSLDPFVVKGIAAGIGAAQGGLLLRATRRGNASRALVTGLDLLAELDDDERQRVERESYDSVSAAIEALGAAGVVEDLVVAIRAGLGEHGSSLGGLHVTDHWTL